jgi:hypothetical protein
LGVGLTQTLEVVRRKEEPVAMVIFMLQAHI